MKFNKLEQWLNDYEEALFTELTTLKQDLAYVRPIVYDQTTSRKLVYDIPELNQIFKGYGTWPVPEKYEIRTDKCFVYKYPYGKVEVENFYLDTIINIDGVDYKHTCINKKGHYSVESKAYDATSQYIISRGHNIKDVELIQGRDMDWISKYCAKQRELKRKFIEAKVLKICGADIKEVSGEFVSDLYVKGSNNRIAHIWAISAGGYNIQRLHIRILVKEGY